MSAAPRASKDRRGPFSQANPPFHTLTDSVRFVDSSRP
jgi:hypothetical protein